MKTKLLILFLAGWSQFQLNAQSSFANTLNLGENADSPKASLTDIAWLAGSWKGEAFGGITEEIWSPPLGNSMMCVFKLVANGTISFYEIVTIVEENETLILRLKHFNADLTGWEERNEVKEFKLVKVEEERIYFEGFTFEHPSPSHMNAYVVIGSRSGTLEEKKFPYTKTN